MSRWCMCIIVLVYVFKMTEAQDDSSVYTSPVLKKPRPNYLEFAGKTYYFGTVFKANFYRAIQYCRQQGMQLVSLDSQAVNDRIGRYILEIGTRFGHFWTSGTNLADQNQWIWLSTGNNLVYNNWYPGEPSGKSKNNVTENCLELRLFVKDFTWNDLNCQSEAYFICESTESCRR